MGGEGRSCIRKSKVVKKIQDNQQDPSGEEGAFFFDLNMVSSETTSRESSLLTQKAADGPRVNAWKHRVKSCHTECESLQKQCPGEATCLGAGL